MKDLVMRKIWNVLRNWPLWWKPEFWRWPMRVRGSSHKDSNTNGFYVSHPSYVLFGCWDAICLAQQLIPVSLAGRGYVDCFSRENSSCEEFVVVTCYSVNQYFSCGASKSAPPWKFSRFIYCADMSRYSVTRWLYPLAEQEPDVPESVQFARTVRVCSRSQQKQLPISNDTGVIMRTSMALNIDGSMHK